MKIRLIGLPYEVQAAVDALYATPGLYVVSLSRPYPSRDPNSDEVRVYVETRIAETSKGARK